jgi:hypothetical protein
MMGEENLPIIAQSESKIRRKGAAHPMIEESFDWSNDAGSAKQVTSRLWGSPSSDLLLAKFIVATHHSLTTS